VISVTALLNAVLELYPYENTRLFIPESRSFEGTES
jgi:hypothetical protein